MPIVSLRARAQGTVLSLCLAAFPFCTAHADTLLDEAAALLQRGDAAEAFQLLDAQESQRAGDPAFDAAMGRAARAAGQYTRAVLAWERVVVAEPDNEAAQLELGRALFAVGDQRAARDLSGLVREQGVPVDAALDVDQFLVSYDRADHGGASGIKGYVELALGHDSNANAGPATAELVSPLPGAPAWTLAPAALATSADFGSALLALRGRYVLDARWSLVGAASASTRRHESEARAFDSRQFDGSAGVSWRAERHEVLISGVGAYQALGGERLRSIAGVQGEWIYRLDGFRQWSAFVQVLELDYLAQPVRDVRRSVVGASYAQVFRNGALAYGMVYAGRESPDAAGAAQFGHRLAGLRVGGQYPLNNHLGVFAALDWERRHYGADDPFFAVRRQDRQASLSLGLSWVPAPLWRVTPQVMRVRNDSSLPVTQYERTVFSVTLRREF